MHRLLSSTGRARHIGRTTHGSLGHCLYAQITVKRVVEEKLSHLLSDFGLVKQLNRYAIDVDICGEADVVWVAGANERFPIRRIVAVERYEADMSGQLFGTIATRRRTTLQETTDR